MKRKLTASLACMLFLAVMLGVSGCTCVQKAAAIGAGAGAIAGAAIGSANGEACAGAAIGAGSGGLVGALVGDGMCTPKLEDEIANLKTRIADLEDENAKLKEAKGKMCEFVIEGDTLFASGSNKLTPQGIEILASLAAKIRKDYPGKPLNIEGHTDNVPISASGWKSNWELGSGRALSVLHYMIDVQKFSATSMSATTFGEYKPVKPNDTPANRQQNRRAAIVVQVQ